LANAAAIPFLDDADIRRDFLAFLPSGGLREEPDLAKAEPDLTGRRSLLDVAESDLSRRAAGGAEAIEAISAGIDMLSGVVLEEGKWGA